MIVRTLDRRYAVLQVLRSDERGEICVCQDLEDQGAERCLLARFRDPALNRSLLPLLTRQRLNAAFEDYLGVFSRDGDVYARFRYTDAPLLSQRLERGDFGFRERLEIGGNLLERMALLNMPSVLQLEALGEENVTVDDALRVRFNYVLSHLDNVENVDMGFVCTRLSDLLGRLFDPERAALAVPELEAYRKELEEGKFSTYVDLYAGYDRVRRALLERTPSGPAEPQTWLFRLWARIKGLARFVRPVLVGVVLIAAFCYLVYTLLQPAQPTGTPVLYDAIGTVEIQQSGTGQT